MMFGKKKKDQQPEAAQTAEEDFKEIEQMDVEEELTTDQRQSSLSPLEEIGPQSKKIPRVLKKEKQRDKKSKSVFTPDGHAVDAFMQENRHAEMLLKETRRIIRKIEKFGLEVHWKDALLRVNELKDIENHYRRKDELLFPKLQPENFNVLTENFSALHREVKKNIRNMLQAIKNKNTRNMKALFNQTYEMIHEGILKEEQVLFPAALSQLSEEEWKEIRSEGKNIGYAWIEKRRDQLTLQMEEEGKKLDGFRLSTGFMSIDRIDQTFNALPVEITVVNEEDVIVYYNREESRLFKRLPSFIGEKYVDCHTGRNEKTVKKIISKFRRMQRENIELYFNMDERKIFVQYKPFYSTEGEYRGFIEIATDISLYRLLEGEKTEIL